MRKNFSGIILVALLLCSMITIVSKFRMVKAEPKTWTVDDDGPADFYLIQDAIDSPLVIDGDTIFVHNGVYYENVIVDKSVSLVGESMETTVIDGGEQGWAKTFTLTENSISITNFKIKVSIVGPPIDGFPVCCQIESSNNIVSANIIDGWAIGIWLGDKSSNNIISENRIVCYNGIIVRSSNNAIHRNEVKWSFEGIVIIGSENIVYENTVVNNEPGMIISGDHNKIYHNNFIDNFPQVGSSPFNDWDDGYPSGGNYWSDYEGTDTKSGPGQDEPDSDGIGDTPYIINDYNKDNYPLIQPRARNAQFSIPKSYLKSDEEKLYLWHSFLNEEDKNYLYIYSDYDLGGTDLRSSSFLEIDDPINGILVTKGYDYLVQDSHGIHDLFSIGQFHKYHLGHTSAFETPTLKEKQKKYDNVLRYNIFFIPLTRDLRTLSWRKMMYKELLLSMLTENSLEEQNSQFAQDVKSYMSAVIESLDHLSEEAEIEEYMQHTDPSTNEMLQEFAAASPVYRELQAIYQGLSKGLGVSKIAFIFTVNTLAHKVVADRYIPYLEWLSQKIGIMEGTKEYDKLKMAVDELIDEHDNLWIGMKSIVLKTLLELSSGAIDKVFKELAKDLITNYLASKGFSYFVIGQFGNSVSLGVGLGLIISDVLWDLKTQVREMHRQLAASEMEDMMLTIFHDLKSDSNIWTEINPHLTDVRYAMYTFRIRLLCVSRFFEAGAKILQSGLIRRQLGYGEEKISEWEGLANSFEELADMGTPGIQFLDQVVREFVSKARPMNDPAPDVTISVSEYLYQLNETIPANVTLNNPLQMDMAHIWTNASNPDLEYHPGSFYLDTLSAGSNQTFLFDLYPNRTGLHAVSFKIHADNGSTIIHETEYVTVSEGNMHVTIYPDDPILNDTAIVTVQNSVYDPLVNASVRFERGDWNIELTSNDTGAAVLPLNETGLWFISANHANYPMFGPQDLVVKSGNITSYNVEVENINFTDVYPNSTLQIPFNAVNTGSSPLNFSFSIHDDVDWLNAEINQTTATGQCFEPLVTVNDTHSWANLGSSQWTSGIILVDIDSNVASSSNATLELRAEVKDSIEIRYIQIQVLPSIQIRLDSQGPLYHNQDTVLNVYVLDNNDNLMDPAALYIYLDGVNITNSTIRNNTGNYSSSITWIQGLHYVKSEALEEGYINCTLVEAFDVNPRPLNVSAVLDRYNYTLGSEVDMFVEITDLLSSHNVQEASLSGIIHSPDDFAIFDFEEITPGFYEARFLISSDYKPGLYGVNILVEKEGYASKLSFQEFYVYGAYACCIVRGMNDRIYYNVYKDSWIGWVRLPGKTMDRPAAAMLDDDLHMVVRGMTGSLYHGWMDLNTEVFSGWSRLNGETPSAPVLTTFSSSLILAVRGNNDRIYYRKWNGSWGGWSSLPGRTVEAPGATVVGDDLHLVVIGSNGRFYHGVVNLSSYSFSGWSKMSGATPSAPELADDESSVYLVVRGNNDRIYMNEYMSSWSGWTCLPGATGLSPGAVVSGYELHLLVKGMTGGLYHGSWDLTGHTWNEWIRISGDTPSAPTLTTE